MNVIPGFKQILTRGGWVDINEYYSMIKRSPVETLVLYKGKCLYVSPKSFASIPYNGTLIKLETDTSHVILKPSFNINQKKVSNLNKGERLPKHFSFQTIEKKEEVTWKGDQYILFYGEPVMLPIKFENDYILVNI